MNNLENSGAFIHPEAVIGKNVTIHPFVKIEKGVVVGDNCEIRSFVSLLEGTHLGSDNQVYEGAVIGAVPQEHIHKKEFTEVYIGNHNVIREHVVINRGIASEHATRIGDQNFLMEGVHLSHDVEVGRQCVLGYGTKVSANCKIQDNVFLGALTVLNKYCKVGRWAFVSAGTVVYKHIPPFVRIGGPKAEWLGVNATVLKENHFTEKSLRDILFAYRLIYSPYSLDYIRFKIDEQAVNSEVTREIIRFMEQCQDLGISGKEKIKEKGED